MVVQPRDRVRVPTQKSMHNDVFEFFYRTGAPTQVEDGNCRLNTKIPGVQLCCLTTNQSKYKQTNTITNPAAFTPNVAFCFWGPEMTILLDLLFGPCLFHL